jgi:hypothetical protein
MMDLSLSQFGAVAIVSLDFWIGSSDSMAEI